MATKGEGTGSIVLNGDLNDVSYSVTYFGLSGPLSGAGGHFHTGAAGIPGPVVRQIAAGAGPASGTVTGDWLTTDSQPLTSALVDSLIARKIYANFHTAAHGGGEIRGQVSYDAGAVTSVEQVSAAAPATFKLDQNYPNPFNPSTTIRFQLTASTRVSLKVYNVIGQEVATLLNDSREAGTHEVTFNALSLASGVYFYRLATSNGYLQIKKMVLLK